MRVTIFDYGAGNLHSLAKALECADAHVVTESDPLRALDTDVLVLPGVGAFGAATQRLAPGRDAMRDAILGGLPTLGICLGMQLFFATSDEGPGEGLGIIAGTVSRLDARRVPQIGWNTVELLAADDVFAAAPLSIAYFANSYVCRPSDSAPVVAVTTHEGDSFPSAIRVGRTLGVQFHPEKSSRAGVQFLHAFLLDSTRSPLVR